MKTKRIKKGDQDGGGWLGGWRQKKGIRREREKRKRVVIKHYERLVVATLVNWLLIGLMVVFVDPENVEDLVIADSYLLFLLLLLGGFFFLLSIILMSSKRALWWTMLLVMFIYLRIVGVGSWINGLLLLAVGVTFDVYGRMKS